MTPYELLKNETEEILRTKGFYIPPYRLSNLLKTAGKIFDLLIKSDICMSYHECLITLKIVMNTVRQVTGADEE